MAEAVHPDERGRVIEAGLDSLKKGTAMNKSSGCVAPTDSTAGFVPRSPSQRKRRQYAGADRHFHDITERKQVEAALRNNEELLSLFIEHAPAALAMFDREMRYIRVSRRWRTNYVPGDRSLIGELHRRRPSGDPRDLERCASARTARRGRAGDGSLERADGSIRWVRWEIRPWRNRAGEIGGIVIFSEDITIAKGPRQH